MIEILAVTSPIYLIIGLGWLLTRNGQFVKADMRVFGKLDIQMALPALVLRALLQHPLGEVLNISYLAAYLCGTLATLAIGYLYVRRMLGHGPVASAVYAMGMCSSNSGFIGYPILLLTLAPVAGVALALNMTLENLIVLPLLLLLMQRGESQLPVWRSLQRSGSQLVRMPLIWALVLGLILCVGGWSLPAPLMQTVNMFANASGVVSLLVIGGALCGLPLAGMGRRIWPVVLGKLVLHPALVILCVWAFPLAGLPQMSPELRSAAILMAAMPMMGIYPTLAQAHGMEDVSAAALLMATATSFFTLSGLLWWLR